MYVSIPASSKPSMYVNIFYSVDHMMLKIPLQLMAILNQSKPALLLQTLFSFIIDLFMNLQKLMCEFISPAKKYNAPDCKH